MIMGIGIDAVDIERFAHWKTMNRASLERIFSAEEIDYCLKNPLLSAPRFAARFAAREAFFKAIQSIYQTNKLPFLTTCKAISVVKTTNGTPQIITNWDIIRTKLPEIRVFNVLLTLTDTTSTATALVTLSISN